MIITCKREIPFRWIFFAILPWASIAYTGGVAGVAFVFSLRKFVENPAGLTFILSLPTFVSIFTGPCTSFLSDRIWTRFGRRKPFIVVSWVGMGLCLALMPLMADFWSLLATFIVYSFCSDLNSPIDPLQQEITPPQERGRSTGAMQWCWNLANIVFYFVALGRFDDITYMAGVPLAGETVIYWSGALLLSVMLLLIMLGIKEIDQKSALVGQRLNFKTILGGILDRELRPVYLLVLGAAALGSGLGPLSNLLYTDQWAYSKQDMGINMAAGGVINIFIIGLLTLFADRLNRMKAYQTLIVLSVTLNLGYFCYVTFLLPDQRPSLIEIITFGETGSIIGLLTGMVYIPLVYDYIRRNKLGTYAAGANLINRITAFVTLNGVGLFIWGYAALFMPPAGEMTRIVLREDCHQKSELLAPLRRQSSPHPTLTANAWQATGAVGAGGRCWEIRQSDQDSERLAKTKERLSQERSTLLSKQKELGEQGLGPSTSLSPRLADLSRQIQEIDTTLAARALLFQKQVTHALGDRMIADGDQIRQAKFGHALLIEVPVSTRPDPHELKSLLEQLRLRHPEVIDLRPVKVGAGYGLDLSVWTETDGADISAARTWASEIEQAAILSAPGLSVDGARLSPPCLLPAISLDLLLIEEPLDNYVSPINRIFNLVLGLMDRVPRPDRRLVALTQNLRSADGIDHLRITPGPAPKTISIAVVLPATSASSPVPEDAVTQRLRRLTESNASSLGPAREFYDHVVGSAATQHLTIARPIIFTAYAPVKYNYMSGYLWMILMGGLGIFLTFVFTRLEARGLVRKAGAEEAMVS